jgi:hypothetical protein
VRSLHRSRIALLAVTGLGLTSVPQAGAQPRSKPTPATRAELERLDKKIDEQQRRVEAVRRR